jgi:hypothetical protein
LAPENEPELLELLIGAYRESRGADFSDAAIRTLAKETLETMRIRRQRLREVLRHLNERNGVRLPDEASLLQLLRFPTPPEPIAGAPRSAWRLAA